MRGYSSSTDLFNKIFVPTTGGPAPRAPIVDRVLANYNRLRQSNRRLSAADKQRLDDHVARIAELQRKLTVTVSGASCSSLTTPTDNANKHNGNTPEDAGKQLQLWNEVAAAAFMCGTSRIGVLAYGDTSRFVSYGGDFHQEVAHQWQLADKQALLVQSYQRFFSSVFLDMARRLDAVEEAPGLTYLDHSLLVWTQESGMETHGSVSIPVVTFGSAAGRLKTGLLCDYRRIGNTASQFDPGAGGKQTLGLLYSQWLATVLQTMGVPPSRVRALGHQGLRLSVHHEGELDAAVREALRGHVVAVLQGRERVSAVLEGVGLTGRGALTLTLSRKRERGQERIFSLSRLRERVRGEGPSPSPLSPCAGRGALTWYVEAVQWV